jgi:hypothetical protein
MTKAIRIHVNGGPDVMCFEEIELLPPGPGEIRIRHTAIGVNFADINVRRGGFYLTAPPRFPIIRAMRRLVSSPQSVLALPTLRSASAWPCRRRWTILRIDRRLC